MFDGEKDLSGGMAIGAPGLTLKGINSKVDVGFLTLMEFLRYSKVGDNFKCPTTPIWVVQSTTHYTVLFTLDRRVGKRSEVSSSIALRARV